MSHNLSAEYWNNRYLGNDIAWDAGAITDPLKLYFDQLRDTSISILIPGAGNSYEAEYLFRNGFTHVHVCDVAPAPLQNLQERCPQFNPEQLLQQDFFQLQGQFDLIIEQTFFCALDPALRPAYFGKMAQLIKSGGRLTGVLFNDTLNSDTPPFGGNKEEYLSYINPSLFRIHAFDPCYNSIKPRQGRELFMNLQRL